MAASARLLATCLAGHEQAMQKLYSSGLFYFALAYCGSNLEELGELLRTAHLKQAFRCAMLC